MLRDFQYLANSPHSMERDPVGHYSRAYQLGECSSITTGADLSVLHVRSPSMPPPSVAMHRWQQ